MRDYLSFTKKHFKEVGFGWLLTFFSSFGQTFLVSLYVPSIIAAFNISNGEFGSIYAAGTLTASFLLLATGHYIDHKPVKWVTWLTIFGVSLSLVLLGLSHNLIFLFLALMFIRFTGQGMMGHISQTVMTRHFEAGRGKALSIASLGYSAGEAVFPVLITSIILYLGWRNSLFGTAAAIPLLLLWPLFKINMQSLDNKLNVSSKEIKKGLWKNYRSIISDKNFGILLPGFFATGFALTGYFFYQLIIAEKMEWGVELYTALFVVYALSRVIFSLYGGTLVDKFSAQKIFVIYLVPLTLAFIALALVPGIWAAISFLFLGGISMGLGAPAKSAVMAEMYGVEKLGTVRSLYTMVMVVSTALGPVAFGFLLDAGWSISQLMLAVAGLLFLISLNSLRIINSKPSTI